MLTLNALLSNPFAKMNLMKTAHPAEAIAMQQTTASINRQSSDEEPECFITLEPIKNYRPEDVFTTLTGKAYNRVALKAWMVDHDTTPHNGVSAPEEVERLFPISRGVPRAVQLATLSTGVASLLSSAGLMVAAIPYVYLGQSVPIMAEVYCLDISLWKRTETCVEQATVRYQAEAAHNAAILHPVAGIMLGLGVCVLGAGAYLLYRDKAIKAKNAATRSLTDAERLELGLNPADAATMV